MYGLLRMRPRVAVALYTDGVPWYPYSNVIGGQTRYTDRPILPDQAGPDAVWARLHPADLRLFVDLEDEATLAELICCTRDPQCSYRMINPDLIDPDELMQQLHHALVECRCNPVMLAGQVIDQIGDGLDSRVVPRMVRCRIKARYLLSTTIQLAAGAARVGGGVG